MDTINKRRMDIGRLFVVPVMALLAIGSLFSLFSGSTETTSGIEGVAVLVGNVLLVAFYLLIIYFYLVRSRAASTIASVPARVLAVVATFLPFVLPFVMDPVDNVVVLSMANLLLCAGLAWSVWSLRHLGRNLSIVAQARGLATTGPYRYVRHPLYLGELVGALGVVLTGFTWAALAVLATLATLQVYRAMKEEQVLSEAFPEYAEYRVRTAALVPRLF